MAYGTAQSRWRRCGGGGAAVAKAAQEAPRRWRRAGGGATATHLHRLDDSQAAVKLPLGYVVLDEPRNVRRHATRERRLARLHLGDKLRGQLFAHCQKIIARIARTLPARQAVSATGRRAADEQEDGRGGDNKQRQLWAITCVRSVQVQAGRVGIVASRGVIRCGVGSSEMLMPTATPEPSAATAMAMLSPTETVSRSTMAYPVRSQVAVKRIDPCRTILLR